ncbi:RNA polymerase-associated protein CTR9 [Orchesella cincta]|uniref:RNA polymerase-associated protein CTR9 n=1 Tax=Orchesella cincta TaxID=48709 RepID=A0A1D2NAA4_ORCCI|nr:RNA polymerase-associated protein CTR9 [Orchesella cincta]
MDMELVPSSSGDSVRIPLKSAEGEYIDIEGPDLPPPADVITALRDEEATVEVWHRVAVLYYRHLRYDDFYHIATEGCKAKKNTHSHSCPELSVTPLALSIAAYFSQRGHHENNEDLLVKATNWYNHTGNKMGVNGFEADYYAGRAFLYLNMRDVEQADKHFTFILSSLNPDFIPALLGKGFIAFGKKDFPTALTFFRRVLTLDPSHPTNVRLCIGHCFWNLNQREKARVAYERALEVQPNDVNALSALAVYHLSTMKQNSIVKGVKMLADAYTRDSNHTVALIFLADHYYFKRDFDKSLDLALKAFKNTPVDEMRKHSAFIVGRNYQAKEDFKLALHYYYEALKEPDNGFLLPHFGLAHCYLHLDDVDWSSKALSKILSIEPNNFLAKKMFGVLACNSENPSKRAKAQEYLKSVLESEPDDLTSQIAFATALEGLDNGQAYENYKKVLATYEKQEQPPPPEILNNVGCTVFSLQDYSKAHNFFASALQALNDNEDTSSSITIQYNKARALEALCDYRSAETLYKEILTKHASYYGCFIRLAVMAREKGNLYESSTHFKEALEFSRDHPDVWAFLGSLHLGNKETNPARQKFLRILDMSEETKHDSYASVALGNVVLSDLHRYIFDKTPCHTDDQRLKIQYKMNEALSFYKRILEKESNNIYAANGVGCILALKGLLTEAREVFSQVREATVDFRDVWMNIAHTYLEQDMYFNAVQMYETINRRFSQHTDFKLLQYIAKAHYLHGSYEAARITLLKCRRVAPYDPRILFVLGLTLRKLGWKTFMSKKADLQLVQEGLKYLNHAFKIFRSLESIKDKEGNMKSLNAAASEQAHFCDDLIKQTPHLMSQVEAAYKEEQKLKSKREMEMKAYRERQNKDKMLRELRKKQEFDELQKRRDEVNRKAEQVKKSWEAETQIKRKKQTKEVPEEVHFIQVSEELLKPKGKKSKSSRKKNQQKIDSDDDINVVIPPKKTRRSKRKITSTKFIVNDDDSDSPCVSTSDNTTATASQIEVFNSEPELLKKETVEPQQDVTATENEVAIVADESAETVHANAEAKVDTLKSEEVMGEARASASEQAESPTSSLEAFNNRVRKDYDNLDVNIFSLDQVTNDGNNPGCSSNASETSGGNDDSAIYEGLPLLVPFDEEVPLMNDFDEDSEPPVLDKMDFD